MIMVNACPNLTILKIFSNNHTNDQNPTRFFEQIISKCKNLNTFSFEHYPHKDLQPVSINHLVSEISQNLVHLRQLYLPDWYLSDNNVRLLTKNIPNLRMVRVHDHMFVSAKVSQFEFNKLIKGSDYFSNFFDPKKPGVVKTEIY